MDDDYLGKAKMGTKGEVSPRRQELKRLKKRGRGHSNTITEMAEKL